MADVWELVVLSLMPKGVEHFTYDDGADGAGHRWFFR